MVKIGLVVSNLQSGGAERQAFKLAIAMNTLGAQVTVFTMVRLDGLRKRTPSISDEYSNVPVIFCRGIISTRVLRLLAKVAALFNLSQIVRPLVDLVAQLGSQFRTRTRPSREGPAAHRYGFDIFFHQIALRRAMKRHHIDLIIGFTPTPNLASILVANRLRIPVVVSERNDIEKQEVSASKELGRRELYPLATALTANTQFTTRNLVARFPGVSTLWLPNDDGSRETYPPLDSGKSPHNRNILVVSRLVPQKRIDQIIRSLVSPQLEKLGPKLHIFGFGPEQAKLEALVRDLDIPERVLFHGYVPAGEIYVRDLGQKFFVINSEYEGSSNALHEAVEQGLIPVAAESVRELRDILRPELLTNLSTDGSPADIGSKLASLILNPSHLLHVQSLLLEDFETYRASARRQRFAAQRQLLEIASRET